jgi:DNA processing protein
VTRAWVPDTGWTGDWKLPPVLTQPIDERERGGIVALSCGGMGPRKLASSLAGASAVSDVTGCFGERWRDGLAHLQRLDARSVVPSDEEYPSDLREIAAPPPLLFVRGRPLHSLAPIVAIVGSRACTTGAKRFARQLGGDIAAAGFTVASGLARGIDAAAHEGAVQTGRSIAVLGTGIDVCYPIENRELAERVAATGALVTEFPPGIGPRAWHFPARNRIISGLSFALIVVEAGVGSGALITAGFALDQGRAVFACTVGPENPAGAGIRAMLKDGAQLVVDADQAVEDLIALARDQGAAVQNNRIKRPHEQRGSNLHGDLAEVFAAVTEGTTVEDVVASTALTTGAAAAALGELELDGLIESSGGRWRRPSD